MVWDSRRLAARNKPEFDHEVLWTCWISYLLSQTRAWVRLQREIWVSVSGSLASCVGGLLGCSTGGCSTIQIEQKLFDDLKSWDVRLKLCSTENWQLSNIKLIELNQESDYVRLILCSTNVMFNNGWELYIFCWT